MQTRRNPISSPGLNTPQKESRGKFRQQEHLKKRVEITRVFKEGRAVGNYVSKGNGYKLFFLANGLAFNRIVITFVRKYGNAVQRNRARRLGREVYRLMKEELQTGYDLVFLAFSRTDNTPKKQGTLAETSGQLRFLFKKAGLLEA